MRRAKIVATLGPATSTAGVIADLVAAGMDVARLNMSHGSQADHAKTFQMVRDAAEQAGRGVGVLADLQGPKIRLGEVPGGPLQLEAGAPFTITTEDVPGDARRCATTYAGLPADVGEGDRVLVDDGKVVLEVTGVDGTEVHTRVVVPGAISNHKGLNLPGVAVSVPALSEKDREDLRFALRLGVDLVALSFVRDAADAEEVRAIMREEGVVRPVIAKIEKPQAMTNLEQVVRAFDAVMVARGDLGVECPQEDVPFLQKQIIDEARRDNKPVIVATQMLESMISAPRPTRAEASDVANAVLDGADAVMLSAETSVGAHPVEAVRTMARIIESTEVNGLARMAPIDWQPRSDCGVIAKAAVEVAHRLGARFLVAFTTSGDTARRIARHRSPVPVLGFTPVPLVRDQLSLTWGVQTYVVDHAEHTDEMVRQVDRALIASGAVERGEPVVIIAGTPPGTPGSTNTLKVHRLGDAVGTTG